MADPTVAPVSRGELLLSASVGALAGAVGKVALEGQAGAAPAPVGAGLLLLVLAALVAVMARAAHRRVQVARERVGVELAVRWLAFARTALLGGSALAAFFLLWVLASGAWSESPLARSRGIWSVVGLVGAVALAVAGRLLERALRVPPPLDEETAPPGHRPDPGAA